MKNIKLIAILLACFMAFGVFYGCKKDDKKDVVVEDNTKVDDQKSEEKEEQEEQEQKETEEEKEESNYKRVVAGTVAVAEMLDVLEFDDVVGVPNSRYPIPDRYKDATLVGRPMEPDLEKVMSLEPDLLISVDSLKESNEKKFTENGVETLFLKTDSYDDFLNSMIELGKKVGKEQKAEEFVKKNEEIVAKILEENKDVEPKKVLFLFGSPKAIMVGTKDSYVGSLLNKIGVINVADKFENVKGSYAPINLEEVLKAEPDVILRMTHASPEEAKAMFEKEFSENEIWKNLKAVKEGKVYDLDLHTFGVSGNIYIEKAFNRLEELLYK